LDGFDRFNDCSKKIPLENYLGLMRLQDISNHYTSVYVELGQRVFYKTIKDGSNQDIQIFKHTGYKTKSVLQLQKEENLSEIEVYRKYFDRICTTENAQTSIRTRVQNATDSDDTLYSIEYYPVSGRNKDELTTIYFVGKQKRLISWFKNVCIEENGEIYKREKISAHWNGLNWNNVTREGNVNFLLIFQKDKNQRIY
jgi:adenine-specific DNA-methyltransferase